MRKGTTRTARRVLAGALAITASLALSSCGSDSSSPKAKGTTLTLAVGGESEEGYDPTLGWGRYGSPLFQSTLLTREADLSVGTDLATDWSVSADGLTWTVDIRTDASFTDGEPVTAADVAYTFTTAATQGGLTDVTNLASAEAVDEDTVALVLKQPQSTFVNRLISLGIVPEHAHGDDYASHPVGSGPFTLVQWQKGQQLVVARNDDYYGDKPAFERLTFLFTDEDASLAAAKAGQVQVAGVPAALAGNTVSGMRLENVTSIDNRGVSFPTVPEAGKKSPGGRPVGNDVTAQKSVRQAFDIAVDRQALVDGVLDGHGSPAYGPVDNAPWGNPEIAVTDDDVDGARTILAEDGWRDTDGDGIVEKDGLRASFTLLYPAGDSLRQGLALSIVDQVKRVGIEVKTEGASWDEIYSRQHTDTVLFGWGSHDPGEMYNLYESSKAGVESWNPGYYSSAATDAALDAAMRATDEKSANEHWKAAQAAFAPDVAWSWLVNLDHTYFVDDCLDLGTPRIEPHGHGWPLTAGVTEWKWTC